MQSFNDSAVGGLVGTVRGLVKTVRNFSNKLGFPVIMRLSCMSDVDVPSSRSTVPASLNVWMSSAVTRRYRHHGLGSGHGCARDSVIFNSGFLQYPPHILLKTFSLLLDRIYIRVGIVRRMG